MGVLLPKYKKAIIDDLISNISSNTSYYYAFAANPVSLTGGIPTISTDDYTTTFSNDWQMLFGKKIANTDVMPVIKNIAWSSGTVYDRYDNTNANLHSLSYYVITDPDTVGGPHNIFMCIDNANGSASTVKPDTVQTKSFSSVLDGYVWRYVASISDSIYKKFSTTSYSPIYANNTLSLSAHNYSGVDVVVVANGGFGNSGYVTYSSGVIQSNPLPNVLQLEYTQSAIQDFYANCGIYLYNTGSSSSQLLTVQNYVHNGSGNWIILDTNANTNAITPQVTEYIISPRVIFQTDGDTQPKAYSLVNATTNAISSIIITDTGTNISWANVHIQPGYSDQAVGFNAANLYAIVPPTGGYGADPESQLNVQGFSVAFEYNNTEGNTIPVNIHYNKIGLIKNPYSLTQNNAAVTPPTAGGLKSTYQWTNSTFSSVLQASIFPSRTYNVGDIITGNTSGAVGTVAFANSSTIYLTGDKTFANLEYVSSQSGLSTQITINTLGDIYVKDIEPLYIQNLNDVQRSNSQTESYKLIIQI